MIDDAVKLIRFDITNQLIVYNINHVISDNESYQFTRCISGNLS